MKKFLELVNIGMVTASIFPFIIGLLFSAYYYDHINWWLMLIFAICMFSLNFIVNILDNCEDYLEYQKLDDEQGLAMNVLNKYHMSIKAAHRVIRYLLLIVAITGLLLVYLTGWPILVMGLISVFIGICYSQGSHPLSRYPVGEAASGLIMGFVIILAIVYLNTYQTIFNWTVVWQTFIVALPSNMWISNVLLANNICDDQADKQMGRRTLVYFLGVKKALHSFTGSNIIAFTAIIVAICLHLIPNWTLLTLLLIPFVHKQTKVLYSKQDKATTFPISVNIMIVCSVVLIISFGLGLIF